MRWRFRWPWITVAVGVLFVGTVHLAIERICREPPNYTKIEKGLWLGGFVKQPPPGIHAVLNLSESKDVFHSEQVQWSPIRDAGPAPSLDWLEDQLAFISKQQAANHAVYVHCQNGVSRSAMVIAAYLMKRDRLSREEALATIRIRRPQIRPHPVFMEFLNDWETRLAMER